MEFAIYLYIFRYAVEPTSFEEVEIFFVVLPPPVLKAVVSWKNKGKWRKNDEKHDFHDIFNVMRNYEREREREESCQQDFALNRFFCSLYFKLRITYSSAGPFIFLASNIFVGDNIS